MKTAMQELIEKIENSQLLGNNWKEKFLEKEKQQIMESFNYGNYSDILKYNSEKYYNEKYGDIQK